MKERPILFSSEMVRAILDGRKTMTRRVVRFSGHPMFGGVTGQVQEHHEMKACYAMPRGGFVFWSGDPGKEFSDYVYKDSDVGLRCPYGQPGDRLWVRETWKPGAWRDDGRIAIDYKASPELTQTPWVRIPNDVMDKKFNNLWHSWSNEAEEAGLVADDDGYYLWEPGQSPLKWRPSIFMPRWASRITLEIVSVRVEKLQDISGKECYLEGIDGSFLAYEEASPAQLLELATNQIRDKFSLLWNSINEKRGFGWDVNPWVWVIEFQKVGG